jgi:hypothetical protein
LIASVFSWYITLSPPTLLIIDDDYGPPPYYLANCALSCSISSYKRSTIASCVQFTMGLFLIYLALFAYLSVENVSSKL